MLDKNNCTVEFTDANMVKVKYAGPTGTTIKSITFDDYCESVLASRVSSEKEELTHSAIFPSSSGISTIQHIKISTGAEWFVLLKEADKSAIQYYDTHFKDIGIPKMLVAIKMLGERIQRVNIMCAKDPIVTKDTRLYSFPFSNVGHQGWVCFGNNRISELKIKEPAMLHSVPDVFLSMPNNDHMYGSNLSDLPHRQLLELLEGEHFPNEWLKDGNITYGEWSEKLK